MPKQKAPAAGAAAKQSGGRKTPGKSGIDTGYWTQSGRTVVRTSKPRARNDDQVVTAKKPASKSDRLNSDSSMVKTERNTRKRIGVGQFIKYKRGAVKNAPKLSKA